MRATILTDRQKHAYLIMVHKNTYVLEKLLQLLDYEYNDIYIHVDRKCTNFNWKKYRRLIRRGQLFNTSERISVTWGEFTQIKAELVLLRTAFNYRNYQYYHLLSGQDLPLQSQQRIHNFFDEHEGQIFITSRCIDKKIDPGIYDRASVKRLFSQRPNHKLLLRKLEGFCDKVYLEFQKIILRRDYVQSKNIQLAYGANWFSLPESVVKCILDNQDKIRYYFKDGVCADELFVQSILREYGIKTMDNNLRLIDWGRGSYAHPYTWHITDYVQLISSDDLFARKFDENVDREIIDKIVEHVISTSQGAPKS